MKGLIKIDNHLINPEHISTVEILVPTELELEYDNGNGKEIIITDVALSGSIQVNIALFNKRRILSTYKKHPTVFKVSDFITTKLTRKYRSFDYLPTISLQKNDCGVYLMSEIVEKAEDLFKDLSIFELQNDILKVEQLRLENEFKNIMKFNTIKEIEL